MDLLPAEGREKLTGYFWPQTEFHLKREAFVPPSCFWRVSVWCHWGPAHYILHFLMIKISWPQAWELQLPGDVQGRFVCLSSPQTAFNPQHTWWHKPGKGEHLPEGPLHSHCLPFPTRQMEIKTVMETCSDCKSACPRCRGFSLDGCSKKEMQVNSLNCSYLQSFHKGGKHNHQIQTCN